MGVPLEGFPWLRRLAAEAPIPAVLEAFYGACGAESCVMTPHNQFRSPANWEFKDGRIVFLDENQGVCVWGCKPEGDDPGAEQGVVVGVVARLDLGTSVSL